MNDDQLRVFWLIGTTLGIELLFSPTAVNAVKGLASGKGIQGIDVGKAIGPQASGTVVAIAGYGAGAILLIALAASSPAIATWLAVLVLAYAVLSHGSAIFDLIDRGTQGINQFRGGK